MSKRLWIVIGVLVISVVGGAIWWRNTNSDIDNVDVNALDPMSLITQEDVGENGIPDHYIGYRDSKVIVIEYGDFACSFCKQFADDAAQIREDFKDRVLFIRRTFALGFPNSDATAEAVEAAFLVGGIEAYFAMYELLWSTDMWIGQAVDAQTRREVLDSYAEQIGIDVDEFNEHLENRRQNGIRAKITRDRQLGQNSGVTGTPNWFVNGERVNRVTNQSIRDAIEIALREAE